MKKKGKLCRKKIGMYGFAIIIIASMMLISLISEAVVIDYDEIQDDRYIIYSDSFDDSTSLDRWVISKDNDFDIKIQNNKLLMEDLDDSTGILNEGSVSFTAQPLSDQVESWFEIDLKPTFTTDTYGYGTVEIILTASDGNYIAVSLFADSMPPVDYADMFVFARVNGNIVYEETISNCISTSELTNLDIYEYAFGDWGILCDGATSSTFNDVDLGSEIKEVKIIVDGMTCIFDNFYLRHSADVNPTKIKATFEADKTDFYRNEQITVNIQLEISHDNYDKNFRLNWALRYNSDYYGDIMTTNDGEGTIIIYYSEGLEITTGEDLRIWDDVNGDEIWQSTEVNTLLTFNIIDEPAPPPTAPNDIDVEIEKGEYVINEKITATIITQWDSNAENKSNLLIKGRLIGGETSEYKQTYTDINGQAKLYFTIDHEVSNVSIEVYEANGLSVISESFNVVDDTKSTTDKSDDEGILGGIDTREIDIIFVGLSVGLALVFFSNKWYMPLLSASIVAIMVFIYLPSYVEMGNLMRFVSAGGLGFATTFARQRYGKELEEKPTTGSLANLDKNAISIGAVIVILAMLWVLIG